MLPFFFVSFTELLCCRQESSDLLGAYVTKSTPLHMVRFSQRNVLVTGGPYQV